MLKDSVKKDIEQKFDISVKNASNLGGGDINSAALIQSDNKKYFVKWNNADAYPEMFEKEAKGLKLLAEPNIIKVPKVIGNSEVDNISYLILEYLEPAAKIGNFFEDFGKKLAQLHKQSNSYFGLDHNNYIGSLPQINSKCESWAEFFVINRMEFQIKMARDSGLMDKSISNKFNKLFGKIENIFPEEKPALAHGDLWGGNYLATKYGAAIIDPAVYYGHREMDLGMSKLFGGFDGAFYESYNKEFPLEKGWQERLDICNLYPLMVHVNLFGSSYLHQIGRILSRF